MSADVLVASVHNALRVNEPFWQSTLLGLVFDEQGGLSDHVVAPPAMPLDHRSEEYDCDHGGVRVPAVPVSPDTAVGRVDSFIAPVNTKVDGWRKK